MWRRSPELGLAGETRECKVDEGFWVDEMRRELMCVRPRRVQNVSVWHGLRRYIEVCVSVVSFPFCPLTKY